jgi:MFS transporter, SET family, sugar efflux transporter
VRFASIESVSDVAPWRLVMFHPFYRSIALTLFLAGFGISAAEPVKTLFLTHELGASLSVAGAFYATNVVAPFWGFLVGSLSDRRGDRLLVFRACALVGACGWVGMAVVTSVWMAAVISAVALTLAGAAIGQLFAAVRDELDRVPTVSDTRVISAVRMAFTVGWVVGPVAGSWFAAVAGSRALFLATAVCLLAQIAPLGVRRVAPSGHPSASSAPRDRGQGSEHGMGPLVVFLLLGVAAMAGDSIKFGYLPIYMADDLGVSSAVRGAVIGMQPLSELAFMPVFALLADKTSPMKVLALGGVFGAGAYVSFALSTSVALLVLGQLLTACLWATLAALGVNVAQQLFPQGIGRASSLFMSATMVSGAVGGVVGGLTVARLGLPGVFWIPMLLCFSSSVGLIVLERRLSRPLIEPSPSKAA